MESGDKVIRFDWAMKSILRDKANFDVLEGFLSAILREEIKVEQILESESNSEHAKGKFNRVDLLVTDSQQRRMIIEVQNEREVDYLERLLFGTSKVIVDNMDAGRDYRNVAKVISISILYFNLGAGDDYVYYGTNEFRGIHSNQPLVVRERFKAGIDSYKMRPKNIFPEYYLINVERFQDVIESPMDEWIYMLKHSEVPKNFVAPNIDKAREKLDLLKMTEKQRRIYDRYMIELHREEDIIETAKSEGEELGLKKGMIIGKIQSIQEMTDAPITPDHELAKMTLEDLEKLLQEVKGK